MDGEKKKDISIKEIGNFTKKNRFIVLFGLSFIFALFFSFAFFGCGWALLLATVGAVLGALFASGVERITRSVLQFFLKQEQTTQLILGVVYLILSIFLPPLVYFVMGAHGGKSLYRQAQDTTPSR